MVQAFTAIDFETAQGKRWSICQVGLVRVEHGVIKNRLSMLVRPPDNYYWDRFTDIHGICAQNTAKSPSFKAIWKQIMPYINGQNVVAHNGFSFDFHCLRQTLEYYKIAVPEFTGHCTYQIYREGLASLCQRHNIQLDHHNALSDAEACAELFKLHLTSKS